MICQRTFSMALAMSVLLSLAAAPSTVQGQTALGVARSGLVTLGEDQKVRLSVINTGDVNALVNLRILVWDRRADGAGVGHSISDIRSIGQVTLGPGEGISLDYTDDACANGRECRSVSSIVEFPGGLDVRVKPSLQVIDARKGRLLLTVLHDS